MPLTLLPPLPPWAPFSYQTLFTLAVLLVTSYLALKAAIRRPMELAKDHWSRNPDKCKSKPSRVTHKLSCDWVYENSKKTSDLGPLTGTCIGRQTWAPVPSTDGVSPAVAPFVAAVNQNGGDRVFRVQALAAAQSPLQDGAPLRTSPVNPQTALDDAIKYYSQLQTDDGHWAGDYGGPMFLLPGLVITCHVTGVDLGPHRKSAMATYLLNHQQEDGGWGLHIESPSTMFGTVLSYVTLRLLGMPAEHPSATAGRQWIQTNGGATLIPSWGKFWLAALGVYEWSGLNPLTPELWALPYWFPLFPGRMWCHCRMVYLPMSYVYGVRASPPSSPLLTALKQELYVTKYAAIDWNKARFEVSTHDLYSPHTWIADRVFDLLRVYESIAPQWLRDRSLAFITSYMHAEDAQTNYVDIGPVNKVLNMLAVWWAAGGPSGGSADPHFQRHLGRIEDYLWVAEDGMKMQGYNGSQLWDTAFAAQALCESGLATQPSVQASIASAYRYIDASQIPEDVPERAKYFRHISKGGWPFSTQDHGWPISDCTAEGLKAALVIHNQGLVPESARIPPSRLFDAVNVLLSFQNGDGGWATYELNRGWDWFEWFNPAEVFGDIMIDYTYVECTSACVCALAAFGQAFPQHRRGEVRRAIQAGGDFIRNYQRPDGGFYGKWAVCFTYGAWFGVEGLLAAGEPLDSLRFASSSAFLLSKQASDGGWGESYLSCITREYQTTPSNVVNTAWALLALMKGGCRDVGAVGRGVAFLLSKQLASGDWAQENISGIFNRTTGITYTAYRNVFPIWALGVYVNHYLPAHSA